MQYESNHIKYGYMCVDVNVRYNVTVLLLLFLALLYIIILHLTPMSHAINLDADILLSIHRTASVVVNELKYCHPFCLYLLQNV